MEIKEKKVVVMAGVGNQLNTLQTASSGASNNARTCKTAGSLDAWGFTVELGLKFESIVTMLFLRRRARHRVLLLSAAKLHPCFSYLSV